VKVLRKTLLAGLVAAALAAAARPLEAQAPIRQQLAAARQHLVNLNADSAAALLEAILARSNVLGPERSWAFALMAVVRLGEQNRLGARLMFEQALRTNAQLPVDSLAALRDLDSEAEVVFREAQTIVQQTAPGAAGPARVPLSVGFRVAPETTLTGADGRLAVLPRPSRPARTVVTVAPVGAPAGSMLTNSDTLPAGATVPLVVDLRYSGGRPFENGRYTLTLTATDSSGTQASIPWTMVIQSQPPVVQPEPRRLAESDLRPETLQVRYRAPSTLLAGAGLGIAAVALPSVLGRTEVNKGLASDATAYVVAGSATVAGIIGFLNGRRAVYQPENARLNAERRARYEADVQRVRAANEEARRVPPIRVTMERSPTP
jgi:hypothetical protein